jgi:hypothetical protein
MAPVPSAQPPEHLRVRVYLPDDALRLARPLPPHEQMIIEGISPAEWATFRGFLRES